MPKGFPKVVKNGPKWSPGRTGSIYSWFLSIFGEGDFSMRFRANPKNSKIDPWSAKGTNKNPPINNEWTDRSPGGHGSRV